MITQRWDDVLFLHWQVEPTALQPLVPLALDLFDGRAWLGVVAFRMSRNRLHGVPLPDFARDGTGKPFTTLSYANGPGYTGADAAQPSSPSRNFFMRHPRGGQHDASCVGRGD